VKKLVQSARALRKRDDGASAVEYGLLVAVIAVILVVGGLALGNALNTRFNDTKDCVANPTAANCP